CPECGKPLIIRMGRFGRFFACSGFPECKHTETIKDIKNDVDANCPKCLEGNIVQKKTKRGKMFYGCSKYPNCNFATWDKPHIEEVAGSTKKVVAKCPECGSALVDKKAGIACSNTKECKYKQK
ncbi:MAG: topoisomerase DNA-binding C4 zinc finger domain-containing protein, partial [Candidatus Spechtbacteria bacterium]|nr:topoisomerase DNA-binding C4 zinc finger domain-containing protein [Candidatus Spechtbacteria bacterium]